MPRSWQVRPHTGWLENVRTRESPNCDLRPAPDDIGLLVIHGISLPPGQFGGDAIERLFRNELDPQAHPYFRRIADLRVSAHLLIQRSGLVTQFVPFHKRAWHAGRSCWQGRSDCNDFAIGIELEGTDDIPYTDAQYEALAGISRGLMAYYPTLGPDRVVGHCDIAPERKTDPGEAFDWGRYRQLLVERPAD